jgi:hypothetical protein
MRGRTSLMGHGPWKVTASGAMPVVMIAGAGYLAAACAEAGPADAGAPVTVASWCDDVPDHAAPVGPGNRPQRVDDSRCAEQSPADADRAWPRWAYRSLEPAQLTEQTVQTGEDEDGYPTYGTAMLPDYDGTGGLDVPNVGAYDDGADFDIVPIMVGNRWDTVGRGFAPRGGRVYPSGAGPAGFAAFGGNVGTPAAPPSRSWMTTSGKRVTIAPTTQPRTTGSGSSVKQTTYAGSGTVARGGMGVKASSGGGSSSGGASGKVSSSSGGS